MTPGTRALVTLPARKALPQHSYSLWTGRATDPITLVMPHVVTLADQPVTLSAPLQPAAFTLVMTAIEPAEVQYLVTDQGDYIVTSEGDRILING